MYPTPQISPATQYPTPTVSPGQVYYYQVPTPPADVMGIITMVMPILMMVLLFSMIIPLMREMVRRA